MTEFTQEDRRDKIRSQLIYELNCGQFQKTERQKPDKSPDDLCKKKNKRAKFMANPRKRKPVGERPL